MDDHNVHHFWGISPAVDLVALATRTSLGPSTPQTDPLRLLQVASYDARHSLTTLCRASRHLERHQGPVHLYIHEEEPELLARHLLLLSVLLDGALPANDRMRILLELHGNTMLRERTATYLDQRGSALERLLVALISGSAPDSKEIADMGRDMSCLAQLLDLSMLKFQERDQLVEAVHKYRKEVEYDMVKAWDTRCRKFYGDRFDFRKNMIDWDYHMRLLVAGTPGQDPALGSIVHFHHFRHWRMHGVAYELRDSAYNQPNRSLLSTALGRTKEFKDRLLKDVGRSVSAWGFWGDLVNGPYHSFGCVCEEPSFFAASNKQFSRTAVDVAEYNVLALLHELRTGERYALPSGAEAHRAKVARGPTSMQDLEQEADKAQQQQQQQPGLDKSLASCTIEEVDEEEPQQQEPGSSTSPAAPGSTPSPASASEPFTPSPSFQGAQPGFVFRSGAQGLGYYRDDNISAACLEQQRQRQQESSSSNGTAGAGTPVAGSGANQPATQSPSSTQQTEEERLLEQEAILDAAAYARLRPRFKLTLVSGDLVKNLTGRPKLHGLFDVVTLGHRHVHLAGPAYGVDKVVKGSGLLVVETAKYLLQLNKEQAGLFDGKITEIAESAGWTAADDGQVQALVTDAHLAFVRGYSQVE